jgi:hypothetical protein
MKILYIYDKKNWAIHNVGRLWLEGCQGVKTDFIPIEDLPRTSLRMYDIIWYGYIGMFYRQGRKTYANLIPPLKNLLAIGKSVISIHDPSEVFPLLQDWQDQRIGRTIRWIITHARAIVVASKEMEKLLILRGKNVRIIPTMSSLPSIDENAVITKKCSVYGVFSSHPRKNPALVENLRRFCNDSINVKFDYKEGYTILAENEYIKELDSHEIFICTSFQEGGPIPAMDAMMRGSVVLTTPVGQIQEIIVNGKNGYICRNEQEFRSILSLLGKDLSLLHQLRLASRRTILAERNKGDIQTKVREFLASIHTG